MQIYRRGNGKVILGPAGRAQSTRPAGKKTWGCMLICLQVHLFNRLCMSAGVCIEEFYNSCFLQSLLFNWYTYQLTYWSYNCAWVYSNSRSDSDSKAQDKQSWNVTGTELFYYRYTLTKKKPNKTLSNVGIAKQQRPWKQGRDDSTKKFSIQSEATGP